MIDSRQQHPELTRADEAISYAVQGALFVHARGIADDLLRPPVQLEQPVDEQTGIVHPWFLMHLASGLVLRVSVEVQR